MQMNSLKCYDVIKFVITDRLFSEDGLSLGGMHPKQNAMYLYQSIDLESSPSCRERTEMMLEGILILPLRGVMFFFKQTQEMMISIL